MNQRNSWRWTGEGRGTLYVPIIPDASRRAGTHVSNSEAEHRMPQCQQNLAGKSRAVISVAQMSVF